MPRIPARLITLILPALALGVAGCSDQLSTQSEVPGSDIPAAPDQHVEHQARAHVQA